MMIKSTCIFGFVLLLFACTACKDEAPYADSPIVGTWELQERSYDNGFGAGPVVWYSIDDTLAAEDVAFYFIFESGGRFALGVPDSLVFLYSRRSQQFGDYDYNSDNATITFPPDMGYPFDLLTWNVEQLDDLNLVLTLVEQAEDLTTPEPDDVVDQVTRETWRRLE